MYNDIIVENFTSPEFNGEITEPDVELQLGNPVCGDQMRVYIKLDDAQVSDIKFQAWGCATSIATANIFCRQLMDKSLTDVRNLAEGEIDEMLGELDPSQHHCLEMLHELFGQLNSKAG